MSQLDEDFDIQHGVPQPRFRQGASGPVGRRVLLGQADPQVVLDDRLLEVPGPQHVPDPVGREFRLSRLAALEVLARLRPVPG